MMDWCLHSECIPASLPVLHFLLQNHCDPDQDKVITEDEWINKLIPISPGFETHLHPEQIFTDYFSPL